ncbi:hypothetical protein SDC9_108533 [bioreactor metagenome]|uniref:Uncharacterized protein n=1 Tax=bioreactor metagenome TaxID=1076179 RepID=A0A645BER8_9ZZZZ
MEKPFEMVFHSLLFFVIHKQNDFSSAVSSESDDRSLEHAINYSVEQRQIDGKESGLVAYPFFQFHHFSFSGSGFGSVA